MGAARAHSNKEVPYPPNDSRLAPEHLQENAFAPPTTGCARWRGNGERPRPVIDSFPSCCQTLRFRDPLESEREGWNPDRPRQPKRKLPKKRRLVLPQEDFLLPKSQVKRQPQPRGLEAAGKYCVVTHSGTIRRGQSKGNLNQLERAQITNRLSRMEEYSHCKPKGHNGPYKVVPVPK